MSQVDPEYRVVEMTVEEIRRVRNDFVRAAARVAAAGARVVEIHAAHGYLLSEFLSPYSNRRADAYGGSAERRARLVLEIVEGVRAELSQRVAISVRISGNEYVEGGLTPDQLAPVIPLLEQAGMDLLNVSAGVYESMQRIVPPASLGETPHVEIAATLKQSATVPVIAVGSVLSLATAEAIISSQRADLVAMGRALIADPELIRKSANGRHAEIRSCTRCNECAFWIKGDPHMSCSVNPLLHKKS
jgi:2,4-dienoyl-CoA reductase-like NADH-dependent reductase (Old Yellow Enzyme family)